MSEVTQLSPELIKFAQNDPEIGALQRSIYDHEFRHLLICDPKKAIGKEELQVSRTKRFMEIWACDPNFRKALRDRPEEVKSQYDLDIDPEEIRCLWDLRPENLGKAIDPALLTPAVLRYRAYTQFKLKVRNEMFMQGVPGANKFRTWRERQITRCANELGAVKKDIVHAPASFELSKGCTVGCWFCGISAEKFQSHFTYSEENARLWREVLAEMHNVCGPAANAMFTYWGTDPMDNPEYEKFCEDFYHEIGCYPQTTTAIPMRDADRTRAVVRVSSLRGCRINRFSILSLSILRRVHRFFSPEELLFVEMVPQNKGSISNKANAGRARNSERLQKEAHNEEIFTNPEPETIACVSGFLFNMVDRTVKLISPCNASDQWPDGYITFETGTFEKAEDLPALTSRMVDSWMSPVVRETDILGFRPGWTYEDLDDGFRLSAKGGSVSFSHGTYGYFFKELGDMIRTGRGTALEIGEKLSRKYAVSTDTAYKVFNRILNQGVLNEEPSFTRSLNV